MPCSIAFTRVLAKFQTRRIPSVCYRRESTYMEEFHMNSDDVDSNLQRRFKSIPKPEKKMLRFIQKESSKSIFEVKEDNLLLN